MKKDFQLDYGGKDNKSIFSAKGNRRSFCLTGSPLDRHGWTNCNEEFARLTDTGNGIIIQLCDNTAPLELTYFQAEVLRLALKINNPKTELSEIVIKPFSGLE